MKRALVIAVAICLVTVPGAFAEPRHEWGPDKWERGDVPPGLAKEPIALPPGQAKKLWRRGERIPGAYMAPGYYVDPSRYHLTAPRPGYRWVVVDNDAYLVEITSGLIAEVVADAIPGPNGPEDSVYPFFFRR